MRKWRWGFVLVVLVVMGCGVYVGSGYHHWVQAQAKIERLSEENQAQAWREFEGYDERRLYGGILAGSLGSRVWVWTRHGLKVFVTDEYSVYSWYDGCNEGVLAELNAGVAGAIGREILSEIAAWRTRARVGDYVRVYLATAEMGGTEGNLREMYTYNFWLFLPAGMEERCARYW